MMPLKKILEWTTSKGTRMWAELYYESILGSNEKLEDEDSSSFIEFLQLQMYADGKLIGRIDSEGLDGVAATFVFDVCGVTHCLLDDTDRPKLVAFDGLKWEELEAAWDALARAFNREIWELRRERRAESAGVRPAYEQY